MSKEPEFAVVPRIGNVSVATQDTSLTSPTNFGSLITGVATGTRIAEITAKVASGFAASIVRVFLYNGSSYFLYDEIVLAAAASSNTAASQRVTASYNNLILPSSSWEIRVTTTIAQTIHVTALGADL
jgi:hypothetical protein